MTEYSTFPFSEFYEAVHGHAPFLWQTRLSEQVAESGWPGVIAAPTGSGKTAVLDIAVHHLASELARGGQRTAPMRIVFAVDRRVIVDQAMERAKRIRGALRGADSDVLAGMRDALAGPTGEALHAAALRGGIPQENDWARTPSQPTILCTTVDQLGSRLLFRGYGVSPGMRPVHAGLLGTDCLILLDEAHLSGAFEATLGRIGRLRTLHVERPLSAPWGFSRLTATPHGVTDRFELRPEEREEPAIRGRLRARKPARLIEVKGRMGADAHASRFVAEAEQLALETSTPSPTVAVVVNRVGLAREIHERLAVRRDAILLTGRVRPVERDDLIEQYRGRLHSGRDQQADEPLFVVATQCIEAGADFDFDALVSQIAPLDALRQRFGRLDRLGTRAPAPGAVVASSSELGARSDDPVYGDRIQASWSFLVRHAVEEEGYRVLDMGVDAMEALTAVDPDGTEEATTSPIRAPMLRRTDLDFLSMTSPRPHPDPHLPLFLHGEARAESDVSIVWRADLSVGDPAAWSRIVSMLPPRSPEALSIPVSAARSWLRRSGYVVEVSDLEGASLDPQESGEADGRPALRWRGRGEHQTRVVSAREIRPGDTLVVPSSYGGCDKFGWAPAVTDDVMDLGDAASRPYAHQQFVLRLHPLLRGSGDPELQELRELLAPLTADGAEPSVAEVHAALQGGGDGTLARALASSPVSWLSVDFPSSVEGEHRLGAVLSVSRGLPQMAPGATEIDPEAVSDGGDAGSFRSCAQGLATHRAEVEAQVRAFAARLELDDDLVESAALAARLHDDGKADPRFQAYLSGSLLVPEEPLAKGERRSPLEDRAARAAASLPEGWRHEVLSVRLAAEVLDPADPGVDPALVLYLVGTHHGYGRPFFNHEDPWDRHKRTVLGRELPPGPSAASLDFEWAGLDWPQLVAALRRRYGDWSLAWLEALVRLADHRASEAASNGRET